MTVIYRYDVSLFAPHPSRLPRLREPGHQAEPGRPLAEIVEFPAASPAKCPQAQRRSNWLIRTGIFVVSALVLVLSPVTVLSDTVRMTFVASAITHDQTIALDGWVSEDAGPDWTPTSVHLMTHGDHSLSTFPWMTAVFQVPVVAAGDMVRGLQGKAPLADAAPTPTETMPYQRLTGAWIVALTAVLFWELMRSRVANAVNRPRLVATILTGLFVLGTPMWSDVSRSAWSQGPAILMFVVALLLVVRSEQRPWLAGLSGLPLAIAYTLRPSAAIVIVAFAAWLLFFHRRWVFAYAAGVVAVLAPWAAVNQHFYGTYLQPYHSASRAEFLPPWIDESMVGTLFSANRGLFVFVPILIVVVPLALWRVCRRKADSIEVLSLFVGVALWLAVCSISDWVGGNSFGPRLLADLLPFLMILSVPVVVAVLRLRRSFRKAVALGMISVLLLGGVAINGSGAMLHSGWCWNDRYLDQPTDRAGVWAWDHQQALLGYRVIAVSGFDGVKFEVGQSDCTVTTQPDNIPSYW